VGFLDKIKGFSFGGKSQPLGIEIGSSAVKVVELVDKGGNFILQDAHVVSIPRGLVVGGVIKDRETMVSELEGLWDTLGLKKREVAFALPGNFSMIETFSLPAEVSEEEITAEVEKRVATTIPLKKEELTFDFDVYPPEEDEGEGKLQVIYAIARREMVDSYRHILEAAGLSLESVKPTPVCLANVVAANSVFKKGEAVLVLEIGSDSTNLLVLRDQRILYSRNISVGGGMVTQLIAEKLNVSFSDAEKMKLKSGEVDKHILRDAAVALAAKLQGEISVSLGQIEGALGISLDLQKVLITGGGAKSIFLEDELASLLGMQVEALIPIKNIALSTRLDPPSLAVIAPRIAAVIGLLLKD